MDTFKTVDESEVLYEALVGDRKLRFTRELSARSQRDITSLQGRDIAEIVNIELHALMSMMPDAEDDLEDWLLDNMTSLEMINLVVAATRGMSAPVPTIEAPASSSPAETGGPTGADVQG